VIVVGLLIVAGGVVASGSLTEPVDDLLDRTDSEGELDGAASEDDIPTEAFEHPINSTALRQGHSETLNATGSFTFEEEYRVESTDADGPSVDETVTAAFDLESEQSLIEISTAGFDRTVYRAGTETYERIDDSAGDPYYQIPDREIGPDPYLESSILGELETMDVEHRETDAGHVYTASGVDAVSDGFLDADVDSFRSFEFEAVVSDRGVLEEFSYRVEIEEGGEVIAVTRSVELTELGTTEVREPTWLDDAREATS
jgi:hypothetical protein